MEDGQVFPAIFGIALLSTVLFVKYAVPVEMDTIGGIVSALVFAVFFLLTLLIACAVDR